MKEPVQLCYTISEAAKVMEVEPHVLRYWEEELGLEISRNSMGHRIYTDDDLKIFRSIKQLKANHVALKDIRQQIVTSGEKMPCKNCNTLIKRVKVNGRSTYYCPNCQK